MEKSTITNVERIDLLKVPVDILKEEHFEEVVKELMENDEHNQIVFITTRDLLRARHDVDYLRCLRNAALVIPVTNGIVSGAKFLKRSIPETYMPFDFVIKLLGILEKYNKSVYLFGCKKQTLQGSERNLRTSFPGLKIVGRFAGFYKKDVEKDISLAIKKASPTLLLQGKGIPGKQKWYFSNKKEFNPGLALLCEECFEIITGKQKRLTKKQAHNPVKNFFLSLIRPWRIVRLFMYIYYAFALLFYKIRKL